MNFLRLICAAMPPLAAAMAAPVAIAGQNIAPGTRANLRIPAPEGDNRAP
jgi:hypothetical protein